MSKAEVVHRGCTWILPVLASMTIAATASAQRMGASIDAGALNMQYADSIDSNALAVTPAFWAESKQSAFGASGTFSQFTAGGWSAQGSADGSLFTKKIGLLLGELEGTGGGSTHNDGARTAQLLAIARVHIATDNQGAWIGGGAGSTWDGSTWRNVRQGEAAAWGRFGNASAFVSATPTVVDDSIKYTDAQLSASLNLPRVELDATGGFRSGSRLPALGGTAKSWGNVSVTGWIASRIAIVASAGTYPVDLTQGFPGGRFASLSLRLGTRRNPPRAEPIGDLVSSGGASSRGRSGMTSFETRVASGGVREIRILASGVSSVELMGDFTNWKPISLRDAGSGWWIAALPIKTGIHEMNVRVNGGEWVVPPGLPQKRDEFGSSVGVLVIQ
jgi:hypothetical protein